MVIKEPEAPSMLQIMYFVVGMIIIFALSMKLVH